MPTARRLSDRQEKTGTKGCCLIGGVSGGILTAGKQREERRTGTWENSV
nr:hypothetical protein [[Eubacterium] cellulosolvens]